MKVLQHMGQRAIFVLVVEVFIDVISFFAPRGQVWWLDAIQYPLHSSCLITLANSQMSNIILHRPAAIDAWNGHLLWPEGRKKRLKFVVAGLHKREEFRLIGRPD